MIQICSALACREKVISLAANVSDVIAMASSVSATDISNAYSSGNEILYPFPVGTTTIVISSITYSTATGLKTVAWSRAQNGTPLTQGSVVTTVPAGVIATTNGASAILVTVVYNYTSPIGGWFIGARYPWVTASTLARANLFLSPVTAAESILFRKRKAENFLNSDFRRPAS